MTASALQRLLPPDSVATSSADLAAYGYDGALERGRPEAVALPRNAEELSMIVSYCARERVPFVARGAGTNLSGGAIAPRGGIGVSLARLRRLLAVDTARLFALAEPGLVNGVLQARLQSLGFFYAPDPASLKVSTLGGNIAENAGGPRCLKYGTTTNHVLALEACMPDGTLASFSLDDPGPEIMSLLVGSEGTLGLLTRVRLKILPEPREIVTLLAGFPSIEAAVECVSAIVSRGIVPRALEAMDKATIESVEAYAKAGYPRTEAALLIELDGEGDALRLDVQRVEELCRECRASELRVEALAPLREKLWEGRRAAYAALARIAPNVLVEDGVVPRDKLPEIVRRIRLIAREYDIRPALLFHAGDGNIHPNIPFDERDAGQTARVKAAGYEILKACVELGGSISGEHGIGTDKREAMLWQFSTAELLLMGRIRRALDPWGIANPGKILPDRPERASPLRPARPLSPEARHMADAVRGLAERKSPIAIRGSGSRLAAVPEGVHELRTTSLASILEIDRGNYTVRAESGIAMALLERELAASGFSLGVSSLGGTLGGALASKACPSLRDELLGLRLLLSNGEIVDFGSKTMKNVAGYDVWRLLLGSWGAYAIILDATLKLRPKASAPAAFPKAAPPPRPFAANHWARRLKTAFDPGNLFNPWLIEPL